MGRASLRAILLSMALWSMVPVLDAAEKVPCRNMRSAADCAREEAKVTAVIGGAVSKEKPSAIPVTGDVVPMEKLEVLPDPEDVQAPEASRWEKMERALGRGRSAKPVWTESRDNGGVRLHCRNPCPPWPFECCIVSGDFSIANPRAKGAL